MVGVARLNETQQVHYLRKGFTFADAGRVLTVGTIPAGSLIIKPMSGVHVVTVFNAGTNNRIDIGMVDSATTDDDYFGTDLTLLGLGFIPLDEVVGLFRVANVTDITATPDLTGTTPTTGDAEIVICYIPDNDG